MNKIPSAWLAFSLLLAEERGEALAQRIVEDATKRDPKKVHPKVEKEVQLVDQSDVPDVLLNIPPPLLFLLIDNATLRELRQLVGADPVLVKTLCKKTDEGMDTIFRRPRFLKRHA